MQQRITKKNRYILWIIIGILVNTIFVCVYGSRMVDSDMSVEMILADFLNETHSIISKDFFYTTELRVFNIQWLFRIGLFLFPNQWYLARSVGMFLLYLCFIGSLYLLCKNCELKEMGYWCMAISLWPIGTLYWFLSLYGGYYLFYATLSIMIVALIIKPIQKWWMWLILLILSIGSGLNGVKQMFLTFGPLVVAGMISSIREKKGNDFLLQSLIGALLNAIGILINKFVFHDYHFYQYLNQMDEMDLSIQPQDFLRVFKDFFELFGYEGRISLLHLDGIGSLIGIGFGIFIVISFIYLWMKQKELNPPQKDFLSYFSFAILLDGIIFVVMKEFYNGTFWVGHVPMVWVLMSLFILIYTKDKVPLERMFKVIISIAVFFLSYLTIHQELQYPFRAKKGLYEVKNYLLERGYQEGYATFWSAHALTELSSGKIDTWAIDDYESLDGYPWGQKASHVNQKPTTRAFLLLDKREEYSNMPYYDTQKIVYEDEYYIVIDNPENR